MWKKLNKKKFQIADHPFLTNGMVFNEINFNKKCIFYIKR